jgi:hypothetical protein
MTKRRKWTVIPGFLALAAAATVLSAYSGASSSQGREPEQPVNFPHPKHAGPVSKGGLGMNCVYCHYSSNKAPDPGMPAVGTCMGCHLVVAGKADSSKQQIAKLAAYYNKKLPVPWVRIHKVPDYVQFPHMRHVNAGVTCQSCHGQVQNMNRVYQAASLNMGWCINCHVNGYNAAEGHRLAGAPDSVIQAATSQPARKARYDCAVCHY